MESSGVLFYDAAGVQQDCFLILKNLCVNAIRLRVWVNPAGGWCGTTDMVAKAVRAKNMGQRVLVDFHYSDVWADPGHQTKPAAWANDTFQQLTTVVNTYTVSVLTALQGAGVTPDWVQVGNETNNGMLWPGNVGDPSGEVAINGVNNFSSFAQLINAGYAGVKSVFPSAKVIIHLSNGYNNALYEWMFDGLKAAGAKWDVVGMSMYPSTYATTSTWQTYDTQCLANMNDMVSRYGKQVMIVEAGMPESPPATSESFLSDLIAKTQSVPGGNGLGVFFWEPEAYNNWQGYSLVAFDNTGKPTVAMNAFANSCASADTVTQTLTFSAGPSATPSFSASPTGSSTRTPNPTVTASPTATRSPTATGIRTATSTDTVVPTFTLTPPASLTARPSSTVTGTPSQTAAATSSPSNTVSPLSSPSTTLKPASSPFVSVTETAIATGTSSQTSVGTPTVTASATPDSTATATLTVSLVDTFSLTLSVSPTPTAPSTSTSTYTVTPPRTVSPTPMVPTLRSLSPSAKVDSGTGTGPFVLTLVGTGFMPGATVSIGNGPALLVALSGTSLATVALPSLGSGAVGSAAYTITLTDPDGQRSEGLVLTVLKGVPSGGAMGPLAISGVVPVPNPNPVSIRVLLDGPADSVTVRVWSIGMRLLAVAQSGSTGPGWMDVELPSCFAAGAASGLYYVSAQAAQGGRLSRSVVGRFVVLR